MNPARILVPLDGSPLAEAALSRTIDFAGDAVEALVLVRATVAHTAPGGDPTEAQIEAVCDAERYLERIAARAKKAGLRAVETHVWYGGAADSIVEAARVLKVDLIVMSTHGRSGLGRLLLGSVAESVLRRTPTPILLLRPADVKVGGRRLTDRRRTAFSKVVVPLDGSPVAEAILPFVLQIAGQLEMTAVLLRVVPPVPPMAVEGTRYAFGQDVEARRREAREYLEPIAADLRSRGVRVDTLVRDGVPANEIVAGARDIGADMIAMCTHGRTGFGRLFFGSVAEAVLRQGQVPMYLLRPTEAQVAAPRPAMAART